MDKIEIGKVKDYFKNDRYAELTGVEIVEVGFGYCKAKMKIEEKHLNAANVVQGGAIFTLADLAFAVASNSHGQLALAININISFMKSVSTGMLVAVANEIADPKKLGIYSVKITDDSNQLVAQFNGMVYRKDQPNGIV